MIQVIKKWYQDYFSDPQAIILFIILVFCFLIIFSMGKILAPALASIIIAYLLQAIVAFLERLHIPHKLAVSIVFIVFLGLLIFSVLGLLPILWSQISTMVNEFPLMVTRGQSLLMTLPERYPGYVSPDQINDFIAAFKTQLAQIGRVVLSISLSSLTGIFTWIVYLVLMPLLVFFFLMDKTKLITWVNRFLPQQRRLVGEVWSEINAQIGNYVRGKVIEIIIVAFITYICFALMDLQYSVLLSVLIGLSVIIPYIGAILVTIPVVIIAFLQWGFHAHFFYLMLIYTIIVTIDANVLVPLLFSEVMNLHPVAIIMAILVFGGWWGFWGVFFAIPLATVVKAVLTAWPSTIKQEV